MKRSARNIGAAVPNVLTMSDGGGRPPAEPLVGLEVRHLQLLLELRNRADDFSRLYAEQLEDFVLELREAGASARGIAQVAGVSSSTVQAWTVNARRRR